MYIKQVIVEGFRSYRDRVVSEYFSPGINVVVGANGSGKSNMFQAIRFALDVNSSLSEKERVGIIARDRAGSTRAAATASASVELVLDNADKRLPIERDEVRIRRAITATDETWTLDGKGTSRSEVRDLLETAGLSSSNPYFIVAQGRVAAMAAMSDPARLAMLEELGGARVHERRRAESQRTLEAAQARRNEAEALLRDLDTRLDRLGGEVQDLNGYSLAESRVKVAEYVVLENELAGVRAEIARLDGERARLLEGTEGDAPARLGDPPAGAGRADPAAALEDARAEAAKAQEALGRAQAARARAAEARAEAETRLFASDLEADEARKASERGRSRGESARAELRELKAKAAERNAELNHLVSHLAVLASAEAEASRAAARAEARLAAAYDRSDAAEDPSARIVRLDAERVSLAASKDALEDAARALRACLEDAERLAAEARGRANTARAELRSRETAAAQLTAAARSWRDKRDAVANEQRADWRREVELVEDVREARSALAKAEAALAKAAGRELSRGLLALPTIVTELGLEGKVLGTLAHLLEDVPDHLRRPVEAAAGNALLHVVVDTDETAAKLAGELVHRRAGRLTFAPINRMQRRARATPTHSLGDEAVPLLPLLKPHPNGVPAARATLGRWLVCRSLSAASRAAAETGWDAVSLEGDVAEARGALRGGHADPRGSRLRAAASVQAARKRLRKTEEELAAITAGLAEKGRRLLEASSALAAADAEAARAQEELEPLRRVADDLEARTSRADADVRAADEELRLSAPARERLEALRHEVEVQLASARASEVEGGPVVAPMAATEAELAELEAEAEVARSALASAARARADTASRAEALRAELEADLDVRRRDLEEELASLGLDEGSAGADLDRARADANAALTDARNAVAAAKEAEREAEVALDEATKLAEEAQRSAERLSDEAGKAERRLEALSRELDALARRRKAAAQRRAERDMRVRQLGALPADAYVAAKATTRSAAAAELAAAREELGRFGTINHQALVQQLRHAGERDLLRGRLEQLDKDHKKIESMMTMLDGRKQECLERTFKGVAKHFTDVFQALVPSGKGEIIMLKRVAGTEGDNDENAEPNEPAMPGGGTEGSSGRGDSGRYVGVRIRARFGPDPGRGPDGRPQQMPTLRQLSGGQRSLVALALVLALQRVDPAPFYLLDEVDAALDPGARAALARLLRQHATDSLSKSQFVVTTFHPQMLSVADACFAVQLSHGTSRVEMTRSEQAIQFLEHEQGGSDEGGAQASLVQ